MDFSDLYKRVFAILKIEKGSVKIAGTGFVINTSPLRVLTCNHVVGDSNENNTGEIRYGITKRTDSLENFDIRNVQASFIMATSISKRPELDVAVLSVEKILERDQGIAKKLGLNDIEPLQLSFSPEEHRKIGSNVEWLSPGVSVDRAMTPRFFRGNLVTKYTANHQYSFEDEEHATVQQKIEGGSFLEIDQLFIPGSSGSPILSSSEGVVIGFVHGFRSWPVAANTEFGQEVVLKEDGEQRKVEAKLRFPTIASLSLGIDISFVELFLKEEGYIDTK